MNDDLKSNKCKFKIKLDEKKINIIYSKVENDFTRKGIGKNSYLDFFITLNIKHNSFQILN
jgi:hypothetical protein